MEFCCTFNVRLNLNVLHPAVELSSHSVQYCALTHEFLFPHYRGNGFNAHVESHIALPSSVLLCGCSYNMNVIVLSTLLRGATLLFVVNTSPGLTEVRRPKICSTLRPTPKILAIIATGQLSNDKLKVSNQENTVCHCHLLIVLR